MKAPQWLDRLRKRAKRQSRDRQEQRDALDTLIGTGKHARQRVRPKGYWKRRRELQRQRNAHKRAILARTKDKRKKVRDRKRKKAERR